MKVIVTALIVLSTSTWLSAQGLVNFANTPSTLVSTQVYNGGPSTVMSAPPGTFSFGLFLGLPNQTWFFTGLYATNTGVDGLFSGGVVAVPGWAAGISTNYFVAGWSGGPSFEEMWLNGGGLPGFFGVSGIGTGVAGDGSSVPTLNLFNGGPGTLQTGLELDANAVPEPSTFALAAVGVGFLLLNRIRRSHRNHQSVAK